MVEDSSTVVDTFHLGANIFYLLLSLESSVLEEPSVAYHGRFLVLCLRRQSCHEPGITW